MKHVRKVFFSEHNSYTDQKFYSEHESCSDQNYLSDPKMLLCLSSSLEKKRNWNIQTKQRSEFWPDLFPKWNMSEKYSSQSIIPIQIKNSTQSMNSALTKNTCLTQKCFSAKAQVQALLEEKKESLPKKKLKQNHALNCVMLFFAKWIMSEIYSSQSTFSCTDQIFYSEHKFCSDQKILVWP